MRRLLDRGADVNGKDWSGRTALEMATEGDHEAVVDSLKRAGASQ